MTWKSTAEQTFNVTSDLEPALVMNAPEWTTFNSGQASFDTYYSKDDGNTWAKDNLQFTDCSLSNSNQTITCQKASHSNYNYTIWEPGKLLRVNPQITVNRDAPEYQLLPQGTSRWAFHTNATGDNAITISTGTLNIRTMFTLPPDAARSEFTVSEGNRIANGQDVHTVTAILRDGQGNPVKNADTSKLTPAANPEGTFTGWRNNEDGTYTANITSTVAGEKTITVTLDGANVPAKNNSKAQFVASNRTYRPELSVSRDVMAAFLYRLKGSPAFDPPAVSPFKDVPTNRVFYREIAWMAASGISKGWED